MGAAAAEAGDREPKQRAARLRSSRLYYRHGSQVGERTHAGTLLLEPRRPRLLISHTGLRCSSVRETWCPADLTGAPAN
ncbi:hypothetical protein V5799_005409 [Amblyomma americanum]|uniref:Uncharacterized protein n=1 Tax=Amblyomma americanum TaxID=6943 RepID=A0AAQ4DZC2_AMBAM